MVLFHETAKTGKMLMSMYRSRAQLVDKITNDVADLIRNHETIDKIKKEMNQLFFDPDHLTQNQEPLVYLAIWYGRLDLLKALVNMGASLNQLYQGKSVIEWVVEEGNFEMIPYLLAHGTSKKELEVSLPFEFPSGSSKGDIIAIAKRENLVNVRQHKLLHKFLTFLKLQQMKFPKKYAEPYFSNFVEKFFSKEKGICNGYTEMWLYKKCKKRVDLHLLTLRTLPSLAKLEKLKNFVPLVMQVIDQELNATIWFYGREPDGSFKFSQVKNNTELYSELFGSDLLFPRFDIVQKVDSDEISNELFLDIEQNRYHASLEQLFWNDIYEISLWDEEELSLDGYNLNLLLMSKMPTIRNLSQYQRKVPMLIKELDPSQGKHKFWLMHYDSEGDLKLTLMKNRKAFKSMLFLEKPQELLASEVPTKVFQEIQSEVGDILPAQQRLSALFEQMLSNLLFFHNPTAFLENTNQESFPEVMKVMGNQVIVETFKAPLLLTTEEMVKFLPSYLTEEQMMKFSSAVHTIGVVKEAYGFEILEPEENIKVAHNIQKFADLISESLMYGDRSDQYIELAFVAYTMTANPSMYLDNKTIIQDKLSLLEKIYQDRIKRGIVQPINIQSATGCTMLGLACSLNDDAAVDWCLSKPGIDVNLGSENGRPLSFAARFGAYNLIKRLLKRGAIIFEKKRGKITESLPLQSAIRLGYVEVVEILLAHATKYEASNLEIYKKEFGHALLADALQSGRVKMLEVLIRHGISLNSIDYRVDPPTSVFIRAIQENKVDMVRKFLEHTADRLQIKNPHHYPLARALILDGSFASRNPLSVAVRLGHFAIAELLIKAGANINFTDSITKFSVLAEALQTNNFAMVKLLVDHGAKITEAINPLLARADPKIVSFIKVAAKRAHSPEKKLARAESLKKPARTVSPQKKVPRAVSPQKKPAGTPFRPRKP